jgi:hypothetical protein
MTRLAIEEAAVTIGRPPEAIEGWIRDGRVEAEPDGDGWLVDLRSLLNAAAADEAAASTNGGSADHAARSPLQPNDGPGGAAGPPRAAAAAVVVAEPAQRPAEPPTRPAEPTVEIASAAIAALNARLEQAIAEVDRLQDERLKLALQLGYAQAQLKLRTEQLRMLTAPAEPNGFTRLWRRLLGREPAP